MACPHNDYIEPEDCTLCLRTAAPKGAPSGPAEATKMAQYRTTCPCGSVIEQGDAIVLIDGQWVHIRHATD
jgi:hypothetical protein